MFAPILGWPVTQLCPRRAVSLNSSPRQTIGPIHSQPANVICRRPLLLSHGLWEPTPVLHCIRDVNKQKWKQFIHIATYAESVSMKLRCMTKKPKDDDDSNKKKVAGKCICISNCVPMQITNLVLNINIDECESSHIRNFDIRGLFRGCSCPNWPKSLQPHENNWPLPLTNSVWSGPQAIDCTSAAPLHCNSRGVNIYIHIRFE